MSTRVVMVTGGVKGIGRAIGLALASDGWSVATCYRQSVGDAEQIETQLQAMPARSLVCRCDVSKPEQCETFVSQVVGEFGRIDALINCAGPYHQIDLLSETIDGWHEMFDNNLHPIFYLARLVAPVMTAQKWGRIVNFSMATADRMSAEPGFTAHFIAKSGVLLLTRALAKALGPQQITANAISPGWILTGSAPSEDQQKAVKRIPAGYIGGLDDVTGAVRFLLSDDAKYINGTNLHVSGGWGI